MIRLFVTGRLSPGAQVELRPDQGHYLQDVMRRAAGDEVLAFNGVDGEWRCRLDFAGRRGASLTVQVCERPQDQGPDLDLLVAMIKRPRLETVVEKAAELGAARVRPVITERSQVPKANIARLSAIAVEASEQTGRLGVPEVLTPAPLSDILAAWSADRRLMFCDEACEAAPALDALSGAKVGAWAILIGPEGGFSPAERAAIRAVPGALPVGLGPRILRADTAAIAALTLWQSALGDLRGT